MLHGVRVYFSRIHLTHFTSSIVRASLFSPHQQCSTILQWIAGYSCLPVETLNCSNETCPFISSTTRLAYNWRPQRIRDNENKNLFLFIWLALCTGSPSCNWQRTYDTRIANVCSMHGAPHTLINNNEYIFILILFRFDCCTFSLFALSLACGNETNGRLSTYTCVYTSLYIYVQVHMQWKDKTAVELWRCTLCLSYRMLVHSRGALSISVGRRRNVLNFGVPCTVCIRSVPTTKDGDGMKRQNRKAIVKTKPSDKLCNNTIRP